jgi:hypothetical protein
MTSENCFAIWAPDGNVWSDWAKPVLFASFGNMVRTDSAELPPLAIPAMPEMWSDTAVVVDLAGADAVRAGLALAERGFRPVPLFNGTLGPNAVVDVEPLANALGLGANRLATLPLSPDARPAFLLDSRRGGWSAPDPGRYDNRWVVLPQDFPSATFLRSRGTRDVVLIQQETLIPAADLTHVLLRWREGGLRLRGLNLATGKLEDDLDVHQPSGFRRAWYAAIALFGLRRSDVGGFGSTVPQQTSGRSGFYG